MINFYKKREPNDDRQSVFQLKVYLLKISSYLMILLADISPN